MLIIVHVEPDFEKAGATEEFAKDVASYANRFAKVINVLSCHVIGGEEYPILADFRKEDWMWGYDPQVGDVEGEDYIRVNTHHEFAYIEKWMKELPKKERYVIVGGSRYECFQDVCEIFDHLGLKYEVKENLIYG